MGLVIAFLVGLAVALFGAAAYVYSQIVAPLNLMASHVDIAPPARSPAARINAVRRVLLETRRRSTVASAGVNRLELAINALSQGIVIADATGAIITRNDPHGPRHADALIEAEVTEMLEIAVQGQTLKRDLRVYGPPAQVLFLTATPLTDDGVVIGAVVQIDDVTERERLDSMRRDFVANLSHELRTPVGAISLLAETVVDEADPATRERLTTRLVAESTRLTSTIDELLELSRIEHDDHHERNEVVVQEIVGEAVARSRVLAETRKVEVDVVVPDDDLVMWGNRLHLVAAVANLVDNAVKYSVAGDSVRVRACSLSGGLAQITVQDTGVGIPATDQRRVFERFYRVDRSRRSDTGGTGLGLSIVRHVVLNHGGNIELASAEGEGSTFTMTFPSGLKASTNSRSDDNVEVGPRGALRSRASD